MLFQELNRKNFEEISGDFIVLRLVGKKLIVIKKKSNIKIFDMK